MVFFIVNITHYDTGMLIIALWKCSSCATPANQIHVQTLSELFLTYHIVRKVSSRLN